ncbi:MAG: hypothetical protein LUD81_11390 [Clostridiales bacterium]|nr:hypothetical protein [Clostridiales bacterium]
MINVQQKIKDTYSEYIHCTAETEMKREMINFKNYIKTIAEEKEASSVSTDDKLLMFFDKLTGNAFSDDLFRAVRLYRAKGTEFFYSQKYETLYSGTEDGEMLLEMFIDKDQNLVLKSVSVKEPVNSTHTVSDFLVLSRINGIFLYEPELFTDTVLGRMYTGDMQLRYTENLTLNMKVKLKVNPDSQTETGGCVLKAKYCDGVLDLERNVVIKEERDSVLNLNVYDINFDWLDVEF